jgi:hypothetical protein
MEAVRVPGVGIVRALGTETMGSRRCDRATGLNGQLGCMRWRSVEIFLRLGCAGVLERADAISPDEGFLL